MNAVACKWQYFLAWVRQLCNTVSLFPQRSFWGSSASCRVSPKCYFFLGARGGYDSLEIAITLSQDTHYWRTLRITSLSWEEKNLCNSLLPSGHHGLFKRHYPRKVLLKQLPAEESRLSTGKKEEFFYQSSACHCKHKNSNIHNICYGDNAMSVSTSWNS